MQLHPIEPTLVHAEQLDASEPAPAAVVSGEVPAEKSPHPLSVFDMFRIGIGPSSSHTVGPMRAGLAFASEFGTFQEKHNLPAPERVTIDLFASLGATGRGHNTDRAVLLGLAGHDPESVDIDTVEAMFPTVARTGELTVAGCLPVPFDLEHDIRFVPRTRLRYHVNALTVVAWGTRERIEAAAEGAPDEDSAWRSPVWPLHVEAPDADLVPVFSRTYYSVGGGFVMEQINGDPNSPEVVSLATSEVASTIASPVPYPFFTGVELLEHCEKNGMSVAEVVRANEEAMRTPEVVDAYLDRITDAMFDCMEAGVVATGILPGGLDVPRRAAALSSKLRQSGGTTRSNAQPGAHTWASMADDPMRAMDWVNLFALSVNEENAAGHRIVTAPTNGAAGIVPAVLGYLVSYCPETGVSSPRYAPAEGAPLFPFRRDEGGFPFFDEVSARRRRAVHNYLLAATAIGALIKTNASIAGAEVGCQGEVGSASAMAAGGLAQALGGSPQQVENAAEIAMEHSLGLTCDPVGGLVQIPCIERNAIASVKAINAARIALFGDGRHTVSLDVVIETMRQTGNDMLSKYKETSAGGLAVNVVEC